MFFLFCLPPILPLFFSLSLFALYWFLSHLIFSPLTPPAGGLVQLQVASQSAVSQEQVDNILQENDALRTNLAALEQVINVTQHGKS